MSEAFRTDYRMTVDAFQVLVEDRPHWERWELIDGEAIMQATPAKQHQIIVSNLISDLDRLRREGRAEWLSLGGIGTRIQRDSHNEVVPDVMVVPPGDDFANWTYEILVAFEVLSPGSVRRDMVRKREFYSRIESLSHYVVLAQGRPEATVFARSAEFARQVLTADDLLDIASLGLSLPIAELYRNVVLD